MTHPSPGVKNRPSIASVVSSVDPEATRYHASLSVQGPRQEIITDIKSMLQVRESPLSASSTLTSLKNAFVDYQKLRNALPNNLIVYRDGVSEGEYAQLEETEIKAIEGLFFRLYIHRATTCLTGHSELLIEVQKRFNHRTNLIFIVVGKRCVASAVRS